MPVFAAIARQQRPLAPAPHFLRHFIHLPDCHIHLLDAIALFTAGFGNRTDNCRYPPHTVDHFIHGDAGMFHQPAARANLFHRIVDQP